MQKTCLFKRRIVRELAWVIRSPPLIQFQAKGIRSATRAWCERQWELYHSVLLGLEDDPQPLLDFMAQHASPRLGKYFENLIAFWLMTSPGFELLARNLQVRDAKHTYGELDLVVRERDSGRVSHWEVALKYYLQQGPEERLGSWLGPNRRDDLERKSQHMIMHQARRSRHPVAEQLLAEMGIEVHDSFVFMKGRLFHASREKAGPVEAASIPEAGDQLAQLAPDHLRSWWSPMCDFTKRADPGELSWAELVKPNWMVDQSQLAEPDLKPLPTDPAERALLMVVGMQGDQERERGFLVPDDWGQRD